MSKPIVRLGVAPTKRGFLSMEEAKRQKDWFMAVIRAVKPESIHIVDIDDICENGILFETEKILPVVEKFRDARIDALFLPHCDFGEEQCAAGVAAALQIPTLMWGPRDERPNTDQSRGRDTQCGMFACTKVLRRFGVTYSYIWNCETESQDFRQGFLRFIQTAAVVKTVRSLRIAKFGARPQPFMSVMANEGDLATRLGVTVVPISPHAVAARADRLQTEAPKVYCDYREELRARFDVSRTPGETVDRIAALRLAARCWASWETRACLWPARQT